MILPDPEGLRIVTVLDRGIPNRECVALRATATVDTGRLCLLIGRKLETGGANPVWDHFLWFGDAVINEDDWVFVYTGQGEARRGKTADKLSDIYTIFWGKTHTVFADSRIVPVLISMDGIAVGEAPINQPQNLRLPDATKSP